MIPLGKSNSFHPGYGEISSVLAGRDRLKATKAGSPHPTAITLIGHRGCGKTALLKWVAKEARERNLPVVAMTSENLS